ncbi:uncharacterized protein LOC124116049 [Haliotis rufescens]|uniref:uncharacterized protein LOC124116049 n=1 Tax=Haliotis rufescens TaxID=6454 RepID=UPI00201F39DE|nr:uncharacterized protein LOC124116049 [Haliotis rufescens]
MKIEIVGIDTPPLLQFWSGAEVSPFVAFYDGNISTAVIFLPEAVDRKDSIARNKVELLGKKSPNGALYDGRVATAQANLPRNGLHLKHQPLRHVQLTGFKISSADIIIYNEEFLSMARTLVLDFKEFLEDQLTSLMNLDLLKRELSLSTAYNQTMFATLDPGEVESRIVIPPSNPRYLAELKKDGLPFVAFYDGIVATAVIFLPGDVDYLKSPPNSARNKTEPGEREGPFVAFYDGVVATAQIFLPGAVDQTDALTSSPRNKVELVKKRNPYFAFYDESVARTQAILPRNVQRLKHQPLRHVQLVGLRNMESPYITHNEEFLSMARTLVLDYKEFLEDQLTSLMNLDLLKRELSLSTAYNQTMLATLDPGEVESRVVIPPSNPRYLAELKKDGLPFVAFYDGIVATAVIFLPGDVDYLKSPPNSARNKTEPGEREGPFVAFYDGVVATAQIFLPGAVDQTHALTSSPRNKVELVKKRNPYFAFYDERVARTQAILPRNVQRLKHQPLRHVQLVGLRNMDSPYITHNEEFLSMARTLVLDFKEFLEDQLSSLMNLALLKRELSLSTAYNQTMLATLDPGEVESRVVIPPSNPRYLAELKKDGLPFVAFYDGIVATAVIFLPGDVDYLKSPPNSARNKTEPGEREGPFVAFYDGIVATAVIFLPGHAKPLVPAPPTPRSSTQMETEPSQDIISNERKLTKPRVLLPFLQKEVPPEMVPPKPRPLVRPQWSRVEKCRLLRDKLDGLPLRYKPRTTKYISFKENEMDTKRRILNAIPSLKPVPPGSCLARSPLTPWYWLEDTYPDMVSASLKDLATQHMKYFRAIPSRAPAQQAGRSQIQIMEDLYWEEVKKMRVPETADENYSRLQLVRCFIRKIQCGSIIKETSLISEGKDKPGDLSQVNTKTAQLNYTACLNTNNNGYTKEEGDCDLDTVNSSVFGSKSDRGFSRGQDVVRNKPRHSYLNKRHSDGYRSRNRRPTGADGAYVDCDKTCVEPEKRKTNAAEDTAQLTDSTLQQCHSRDAKLPQGKEDKILLSIKRHPERGLMPPATYRAPTSGHHGNHLNKVVVPPLDLQDDSKHLKELFKDVSQYNSLCDVPDSVKERVVLLICTPFLEGGYSSGLCFLSNLIESSEESSPGRPWQNLEQCLDQCGSTEGTAQNHTSPSMESEEYSTIQMERDLWYREAHYRR